ncbi:hypothetical protein Ddye_023570 [Dipteronia dyeriana]|uniref:Transposase MuDR plant domain-containing protein n=1 Tax=Dipteronia dyeriana TaxID=168575 RepID=A0AAD9WTG1_9ROSI|nr:hypothetical protein Ddye_023570 [Dipteronia dyeriana]
MNNEENTGPNLRSINEFCNEVNFHPVDNVANNVEEEEHVPMKRRNFEWKVKRFNKTTLHLVCLMDNCTWKLRAMRRDEGKYFQVKSFVNEHTCSLEEIHCRHR